MVDARDETVDASRSNVDVDVDVVSRADASNDGGSPGLIDVQNDASTSEDHESGQRVDADGARDEQRTNDVTAEDHRSPGDDGGVSDGGRCSAGCPREKPQESSSCAVNALACEYGPQCAGWRCLCTNGFWQCQVDRCWDESHDVVRDEQCVIATPGTAVATRLTQDNIRGIESGGGYVYWTTERQKSYLRRTLVRGGPVEQIQEQAGTFVAVDGDVVYELVANRLVQFDVNAGCATDLADLGSGAWLQAVVDADSVYVSDGLSRLVRVAKVTGAVTELNPATSLMQRLAVSDSYLYFVRTDDIARYPVGGGNVELVVPATGYVERMLVDAQDVFWLAPVGDAPGTIALNRVSVRGGVPSVLWTTSKAHWGMAADASAIYVGTHGACGCGVCDDLIIRVPKAGGSPTVLVGGQNSLGWRDSALTVNNGFVAWLNSASYEQLWSAPLP